MIVNRKITIDKNDPKKQTILENTFDCQDALDLVTEANKNGGERTREIVCKGHIPPEMWMCDPWLIVAKKAMREGDTAEYMRMVDKFFNLNPRFKINHVARVFAGLG